MQKILLVSANNFSNPYPVYPIGLSYLWTYQKKNLKNYEFDFFDFNLNSFDDFESILKSNHYRYIELSLRNIDDVNIYSKNTFITHYKKITSYIRKYSQAVLLVGGSGFSIFPELLLKELEADYGIKGEGEESNIQLINALDNGGKVSDIEGLVYRNDDGDIIVNGRAHFVRSIDVQFDEQLTEFYWPKSGMLNIQTKRGCPKRCIYCSYPVIEGRVVRTLDPYKVVENIVELNRKKEITYLFFTDSIFNINREYNYKLCNLIIDSGVKINWGAYFSPSNLTYEDLKLYQKAGLTHIEFGTESFSDSQLVNYQKDFKFEDILRTSIYCNDLGIFFAHFLILCGYGETEDSLAETFENSKKIENSVFFPYIGMRIYPDTDLCDVALKEGIIKDKSELINPIYYISKDVDISHLKEDAAKTGMAWVFPDTPESPVVAVLRKRKVRGPMWEYYRYYANSGEYL